jgi:hypothetical protein
LSLHEKKDCYFKYSIVKNKVCRSLEGGQSWLKCAIFVGKSPPSDIT